MSKELIQDFKDFITTLLHTEKGDYDNSHAGSEKGYFYADDYEECSTYGIDFNRDLLPPNTSSERPEGGVAIRVDDDFFVVAFLPWKYHELSILELVKVLWPKLYDKAHFYPDSQDSYWSHESEIGDEEESYCDGPLVALPSEKQTKDLKSFCISCQKPVYGYNHLRRIKT